MIFPYIPAWIPAVLAWLVVLIAFPTNWFVTWRLWRLSRSNPQLGVLRERALVALALAVVVTVFAAVFLNNGMAAPLLDLTATQIITRLAILSLSIPAIRWLWIYRNGDH